MYDLAPTRWRGVCNIVNLSECLPNHAALPDESIPGALYLVGDAASPRHQWHAAMVAAVAAVAAVTHLAPAGSSGLLVELHVQLSGVANSNAHGKCVRMYACMYVYVYLYICIYVYTSTLIKCIW